MEYLENVKIADQHLIVNVIRRSLGCIDKRLIDHGERVAYIAGKIAERGDLHMDRQKLLVLCMLHDIGAYKTEEIDNMIRFETDDVMNHAVYGYVFLRNTTPLGRYAEAILYHHTHYDELTPLDTPYKRIAALIFLADRIDILLAARDEADWEPLRRLSGTVFSPELVSLFLDAEAAYDISGHIRDGSYRREIDARLAAVVVPEEDIASYLRMLVCAIDFRSPFTITHTANTTTISAALAEFLGLGEEQAHAITLGAFLHDVGKIVIPASILEKPGRLCETELRLMRTHVIASGEIIDGLVSDEVYRIAVRHHEKLNGTGYPLGLRADELTTAQRIVAVADILSALIGRRSYKESFSKEKTIAIIRQMCRAGELCPRVCDAAIEQYDEILRRTELADNPIVMLYETIRRQYDALALQMTDGRAPILHEGEIAEC